MFKFSTFVFLAVASSTCFGQEEFPLTQVEFQKIFGQRTGEQAMYCLLGNGFFRTIHSDEGDAIISEWRRQHPNAKAVPVSIVGENSKMPIIYVWAVDGDDNLNLLLIKKGVFPASVMLDAVHFDQLSQLAKGTPERASVEAGFAYGQKFANRSPSVEIPPRRLVSDTRYTNFVKLLVVTESAAQVEMNGIWSDKFKGLRDEEDITPLSSLPVKYR